MQDNNFSNLRLQFIHENKPYNVSIPSTNETTAKKITIAGKQYTYDEKSEMPENLKHILQSLPENQTFETEKEFLSLLSKEAKIDQMSLTKRVYSLQDRFIGMSNVDTAQLKQIKKKVENELLLCDPSDMHTIEHIIKNADLPIDQTKALFEIADHIQGKGHVELAQTIRKIARPFDLEKTIHTISELFVAKYLYKDKGIEISAKLQKLFDSGRYDSFYDPKEFAMELSIDLRADGNDQHLEILYGPPEDNVEVVKINTNTVDHIGYFELTKFQDPSDLLAKQKVKETLDTLRKSNPEAIIIDLRQNSGGNPYMMTYIASHFLEPDKLDEYVESDKLDELDELDELDKDLEEMNKNNSEIKYRKISELSDEDNSYDNNGNCFLQSFSCLYGRAKRRS